jgi:hypothetical protein
MRTLLAVVAVLGTCGPSCADDLVPCTRNIVTGLVVAVVNSTGTRICGATVVASGSGHTETLVESGTSVDCSYAGLAERAGTFTITVSKAGYQTEVVSDLSIEEDQCHVIPQSITVTIDSI